MLPESQFRGAIVLQTYTGTLNGGQIAWDAAPPEGEGVRVTVTVESDAPKVPFRNEALGAILERLAASDICKYFPDPLEWQREIRKDRPLPGREED